MSTPYVTGPALVYFKLFGGDPQFLGTCENTPVIAIRPGFEPYFNTLGGTKIPMDMTYQGEEAFVSGVFNKFNEEGYAELASRPVANSVRGINVPGDVGTMMVTEGKAYDLYVVFPFFAKPFYADRGMPAGYHFPAAYLAGPDELKPLGTVPTQRTLVWHCLRSYILDPGTLGPQLGFPSTLGNTPNLNLGFFYLYDTFVNNFSNLPTPD